MEELVYEVTGTFPLKTDPDLTIDLLEDLVWSRFIETIENKHLAKHIAFASFHTIREHIIRKAQERHIVVCLVDRFYPSSKICTSCGSKIDRDFNAACNLANTSDTFLLKNILFFVSLTTKV